MKKILLIALFGLSTIGCNNSPTPIAQNANSPVANSSPERAQTAIAHGPQDNQPSTPSSAASKWTQSGDAFDTTKLDADIAAAEKAYSSSPAASKDVKTRLELANAYLRRATALTEKRQYASALGDYRRTLKYDPANAEAKQWIEQIINIYKSINRSYPAEGEEPPPLKVRK